ncbi:putative prophage protein [Escherichia coli]|nr:putative prophage protein [Escherichia coli]
MLNHTTHPQGRDSHNLNKYIWRFYRPEHRTTARDSHRGHQRTGSPPAIHGWLRDGIHCLYSSGGAACTIMKRTYL